MSCLCHHKRLGIVDSRLAGPRCRSSHCRISRYGPAQHMGFEDDRRSEHEAASGHCLDQGRSSGHRCRAIS